MEIKVKVTEINWTSFTCKYL